MVLHRTLVGLHARNDYRFTEPDYLVIKRARIETLKMLSLTEVSVYERVRKENPGIEFIVRLYDDRFSTTTRPRPADFAAKMIPVIKRLKPFARKFEIHNEPNHADGIEGWGPSDEQARSFRAWYLDVRARLKAACPWAEFGFPGLALNYPHRDLDWLDICADAVHASDWLGCHCYWQYGNMLSDQWGLRFKLYHDRFPDKPIEITEFGNSTPNLSRDEIARQYVQYYTELNKYPYLGSASAFIASSPDPAWALFVWMKEGGEILPVVQAVGAMDRKPVEILPVPKPEPPPPPEKFFPQTGKTVRGPFLSFLDTYGLEICGYPITDQITEDGKPAQYFQRVALEEAKAGKIALKLVGTEAWTSRARIAALLAEIEKLKNQPVPAGVPRPALKNITAGLPVHAVKRYPTRPLSEINQIVVHHTATGETITPQRLADYQVRQLDKPGILYHFFVAADGTLYQTNELETVSDHAYGRSPGSVGVVFPGNFTDTIPPPAQLKAGARLIAWLLSTLRLPAVQVLGLGEFVSTQSPGKQWLSGKRWKDRLLAEIDAVVKGTGEDRSALQAALQARIAELESEVARMCSAPPAAARGPARPPRIVDIAAQLPVHPDKRFPTRTREEITEIVIHHTGGRPDITPQRLAEYQVQKLDQPGILYHYLVAADGTVYQTNPLETASDHAFDHSRCSVGIVFPGNFSTGAPTEAQLQAGGGLIAWLLDLLKLDPSAVRGLGEFANTQSPGTQWRAGLRWRDRLLFQVDAALRDGGQDPEQIIAELRARIAELENKIAEQEATLTAQQATIAAHRATIAALEAQIEKLKRRLPAPGDGRIPMPAVQNLVDRLPRHATKFYNTRDRSAIRQIIIHHSATGPTVTPQRIAEYHVNSLGWPGIGYHFMVGPEGVIYQGNLLETISYQAAGANARSVGICLFGNFAKNTIPPAAQLSATARLIAWLMQDLDVTLDDVVGHQEVLQTACPGNEWAAGRRWKDWLRQEIVKVQQAAGEAGTTPGRRWLYHYMLFWHHDGTWAQQDWLNAQAYIARFRPAAGFSVEDASLAEYVTIVGGPLGVPKKAEDWLVATGSKVERIAGKDEAETKRLLDDLVVQGKRFMTLSG